MAKTALADKSKTVKQLFSDSRFREAKSRNDSLRLWESYREQALLWRALALFQIPVTVIALVFALVMWSSQEIVLNVPAKPLPGYYKASEIPDEEFISVANEFLNLIASYQPQVARRQFNEAMKYLKEPMLTKFQEEMLGRELKAIENTRRTQIYFVDPTTVVVNRNADGNVVVALRGERLKYIAGKQLPEISTQFEITMTTVPRNTFNPYGIMIANVEVTNAKR